jgi:hypothetical protein
MLKIFKNQVNYSTKMGKNLYYDVLEESKDSFCTHCNSKYLVTDSKFAPCQKIEILSISQQQHASQQPLNLCDSIATCWLVDPFINMAAVGDVINLTAYYFLSPAQ